MASSRGKICRNLDFCNEFLTNKTIFSSVTRMFPRLLKSTPSEWLPNSRQSIFATRFVSRSERSSPSSERLFSEETSESLRSWLILFSSVIVKSTENPLLECSLTAFLHCHLFGACAIMQTPYLARCRLWQRAPFLLCANRFF